MPEHEWGVTAQERVLDYIYESLAGRSDSFVFDIYGVEEGRKDAVMYIKDNEDNCWEITATLHNHKEN